jgi:hypothetical protein
VFNTTDEKLHKQIKNPIAPIFSVSSTATFEGLVDDVLTCLVTQFDQRFIENGEVFDLGQWLQFFAFDVMGTMTFSKRYGFLDTGRDVGDMLGTIVDYMRSGAPVRYAHMITKRLNTSTKQLIMFQMTQIPWLDRLLRKNIISDSLNQIFGRTASLSILGFVGAAIKEKREKLADPKSWEVDDGKKDFLTRYIQLQQNNPEIPPW